MRTIHVAMLDVASVKLASFDAWYRTEHLPGVLSRPGWVAARTYDCSDPSPSILTVHDIDDRKVDLGDRVSAVPFAREDEYGRSTIHAYREETYRQEADPVSGGTPEGLLNLIFTEVRPEHAAAFDDWYRTRHIPEILACPGWLSARRFTSLDRPGRFLTMYELSDEELPFSTPEYRRVVGWDDHVDHLLGFHGFRIYRHQHTIQAAANATRVTGGVA